MTATSSAIRCVNCDFKSLLFNNLKPKELEKLDRAKKEHNFKRGDLIITEGQEISEFIYLQKGLVKLTKKTENQKDHIISLALPTAYYIMIS